MVTVSSRGFLLFLAPILVSTVCSVLAAASLQAREDPSFLLATERLVQPVTWLDHLEHKLTTYSTKKYPAHDFSPYTHELSRIRDAARLGDRWGAQREMGIFFNMLMIRAYGLGGDAAEELAVFSQRIMPDQEFGMIYHGSETEPPTEGVHT